MYKGTASIVNGNDEVLLEFPIDVKSDPYNRVFNVMTARKLQPPRNPLQEDTEAIFQFFEHLKVVAPTHQQIIVGLCESLEKLVAEAEAGPHPIQTTKTRESYANLCEATNKILQDLVRLCFVSCS